MLEELLNLKYCKETIIYEGAEIEIQFRFDRPQQRLFIKVLSTTEVFTINEKNLEIKNKTEAFTPTVKSCNKLCP